MKKYILPLLLLAISLVACKDDDNSVTLNLDGDNFSAPELDPGSYRAAVRFSANMTSPHTGKKMDKVRFWMGFPPANCIIKIYNAGTASEPGSSTLYTADITNSIQEGAWNEHTITRDLIVGGEDIWVSIEFDNTEADARQMIGCDAEGNGVTDGDWLFQSSDNQWLPYKQRAPVSINWNIRLNLTD